MAFIALVAPLAVALTVQEALQQVANTVSSKYDCAVALAYRGADGTTAEVAAGHTDHGLGSGPGSRLTKPDDDFVWGSTTKMFTGAAVLQLVSQGAVSLDDPIAKHVDPLLKALNGTSLSDHFGDAIASVKVRHLLHMTSGLHDYDEGGSGGYFDAQWANKSHDFGPIEIISRFVPPKLDFAPGKHQMYSSTNYIILGLLLASHAHAQGKPWLSPLGGGYDQSAVYAALPAAQRPNMSHSRFVDSGSCAASTPVRGYMRVRSKEHPFGRVEDITDVSCVGGWTAGNYVGPVADVAEFTQALYSTRAPKIVPAEAQAQLTNFTSPSGWSFYGMGTFDLGWSIGKGEKAWGHVGDTYGYQSQTTYFEGRDFSLAVATNIESGNQAQPADGTCRGYHAIAAALDGVAQPNCSFTVPFGRKFIGTCKCE